MNPIFDLIIIGAGPAGLSAGIYGKRAGLNLLLLEREAAGGQVNATYEVDNYPGLPGSSGMELSNAMKEHFERLGGSITSAEVIEVEKNENGIFYVGTTEGTFQSKTVILASGAHHARLGAEGEEELTGMGVSYCATCDGAFYKDSVTAVIGGGDVAVEDAIFLARFCEKVYLIHRRDVLRAQKSLQDTLFDLPNVEVIWKSEVTSINGDGEVESITVHNKKENSVYDLPVEGVFVAVGILPDTSRFSHLADVDEKGYFIAKEDGVTKTPGLFVAGDARKKPLRQIITAAADGANAVTSATEYLRGC